MPRYRYTTRGDIRGRCGHWHWTLRAAVQCLAAYRRQLDALIARLDRQPPDLRRRPRRE
jgi:hypothetical protein